MVEYRIQKRKSKWFVLKNNKTVLGGYPSALKARQAKDRKRAQDKYARKMRG